MQFSTYINRLIEVRESELEGIKDDLAKGIVNGLDTADTERTLIANTACISLAREIRKEYTRINIENKENWNGAATALKGDNND